MLTISSPIFVLGEKEQGAESAKLFGNLIRVLTNTIKIDTRLIFIGHLLCHTAFILLRQVVGLCHIFRRLEVVAEGAHGARHAARPANFANNLSTCHP